MKHTHGQYTIEITREDPAFDPRSPDNFQRYSHVCRMGEHFSSACGIRVLQDDTLLANALVLAGGGASGIHAHSTLLREEALLLTAGAYVVKLAVPSLNLVWARAADDATCFGIHAIPGTTDFWRSRASQMAAPSCGRMEELTSSPVNSR